MGQIGRRRRMQVGLVEFGETPDPEQPQAPDHLVLEQFQHPPDSGLARRRERPAGASPAHGRRPMPTRPAPAAIALTMSVPRQNEPSTMILARPATALTISGRTCIAPRPWSSWRPPWFDT